MSTILIEVRRAKPSDATAIATTHDEAWRGAYQGVIPGPELDKLINRRGPQWWDSAIRKGSRIAVLAFGECIAGYANYGRNRARSLYYDGEIYELYLRPEFQGLGFGRKLFTAAARPDAERAAQPGGLGAVRQRAGGRILPRARRQGGGALFRAIRHPRARQGRLRLERLSGTRTFAAAEPGHARVAAAAILACSEHRRRQAGMRRPRAAYWPAGTRWSSDRRRPAPA